MNKIRILAVAALCGLLVGQADAQSYTGPRVTSTNSFQVGDVQPEGVYCTVNGDRRIEGEVVNLTGQVLTVRPLTVPTKTRCRADTFKHGDTIVMFTTRRDRPNVGQSPPMIFSTSAFYGCRTYQGSFLCNASLKMLQIDAIPVPLPVTPPPVVVDPTKSWVQVANENTRLATAAGTKLRFGRWTTWVEATPEVGALCSIETFGSDPLPGEGKVCEAWQ